MANLLQIIRTKEVRSWGLANRDKLKASRYFSLRCQGAEEGHCGERGSDCVKPPQGVRESGKSAIMSCSHEYMQSVPKASNSWAREHLFRAEETYCLLEACHL